MTATIFIRGAGDLASGVAVRLFRSGLHVVMTELAQPLAVRRRVSFAEAIYEGSVQIEGISGRKVPDRGDTAAILRALAADAIPVLVDPECAAAGELHPLAIIDGRMTKQAPEPLGYAALMYIGLGPGFRAPLDCHAVIETERGHSLGRVITDGSARADSGRPEGDARRVLRSPADGVFQSAADIGRHYAAGEVIGHVGGHAISAPFAGVLRGLLRPGSVARRGMKVGDIDARDDPELSYLVSDKALAIGGGVLEALLSNPEMRSRLWA